MAIDRDAIGDEREQDLQPGPVYLNHQRQRGVALIIAIMIISIMMLFTSDLIVSSQVNIALATSHRDNVKAEYMAKSGFNAALLLISADMAYDLFMAQQDPKGGGLSDSLADMWTALNGFPIGGETLEMLNSFQEGLGLSSVVDSGILQQLKLFDGQFVVQVSDEERKINVNFCTEGRCSETLLMLEALFSCPAEKQFLDQKKLTAKELAGRIKDWVDKDNKAEPQSGYSDEDDPYRRRDPEVRAKNAPFDTIDELRMIEGWDEEVHAVFSPYLTIWPFYQGAGDKTSININTASRSLLQCLFPESKGDFQAKTVEALLTRNEDKLALGEGGKSMAEILRDLVGYTADSGSTGTANNRVNWFSQRSSVFRVEASGTVGDSERRLVAIVQRTMPDMQKKEKTAYKILFWKVI